MQIVFVDVSFIINNTSNASQSITYANIRALMQDLFY